jgi:hypothetical protein
VTTPAARKLNLAVTLAAHPLRDFRAYLGLRRLSVRDWRLRKYRSRARRRLSYRERLAASIEPLFPVERRQARLRPVFDGAFIHVAGGGKGARLDFGGRFETDRIADEVPPIMGKPFETLVPKPDADGLDEGGIALPELLAPLPDGLQHAQRCCRLPLGQWQVGWLVRAVPVTEWERQASGDPRVSLEVQGFCAEAGVPVSTTHHHRGHCRCRCRPQDRRRALERGQRRCPSLDRDAACGGIVRGRFLRAL